MKTPGFGASQDLANNISDNLLLNRLLRALARFGVFIAGAAASYYASFKLLPRLDAKLPLFLAIFIIWIVMAYGVFPALIRVLRLAIRPDHIPHNAYTPDGFVGDPVNIAIIGTRKQLVQAFELAGWSVADKRNLSSSLKTILYILLRREYSAQPMSSLFLFGRRQDLGFQKGISGKIFHRHHVRFWAISAETKGRFSDHVDFWRRRLGDRRNIKLLWMGAAIKDDGLTFIRYHGQITHSIEENTNLERDYIVEQLLSVGGGIVETLDGIVPARTIKNRAIGDAMTSDGKIKLLDLTRAKK